MGFKPTCLECNRPVELVDGHWRHVTKNDELWLTCMHCRKRFDYTEPPENDDESFRTCEACGEVKAVITVIHRAEPIPTGLDWAKHKLFVDLPEWWHGLWRYGCLYRYLWEPWYKTKCALFLKYNVVRVKLLPPTWVDRSDLLIPAMFTILQDFVEREDDRILTIEDTLDEHLKNSLDPEDYEKYLKYRQPDGTLAPEAKDDYTKYNAPFDWNFRGDKAWWEARKTFKDLYNWWMLEDTRRRFKGEEFTTLEDDDAFDATCDEKAKLLLKYRGYMWT